MNLNDCVHSAICKNYESRYVYDMTRKVLAKNMGISYSTIQRFFNDPEYKVDVGFIEAYATATKQSVKKILLLIYREMEEKKADNGIEDEADEPVYVQKMKEMGFNISGF